MPKTGPFILVINHLHWLDPPLIFVSVPRVIRTYAKWEARNSFQGLLLTLSGAIYIKRGLVDRSALKAGLAVLERGEVLGIAPEGTRSKTGSMQSARAGTAYLASQAGVPILPVGVIGTHKATAEWRRLRRPTIKAVIGRPFRLPSLKEAGGRAERKQQLAKNTTEIMLRLAELLPAEYRGAYSDWTDSATGPASTSQTHQEKWSLRCLLSVSHRQSMNLPGGPHAR